MDSILWSSGLFAADAYQWKEKWSTFKSWGAGTFSIEVPLSDFQNSIMLIIMYGGVFGSSGIDFYGIRVALRLFQFPEQNTLYFPIRLTGGAVNASTFYGRLTDAETLEINWVQGNTSGAFSIHIFDPA